MLGLETALLSPASSKISSERPGERGATAWISLLLAAVTLVCYWSIFHAQFINYDDNEYVTNNGVVRSGLTWRSIVWAFTSNHASNWHPVTWLSHMLDISLFGMSPVGPHAVNLALHIANTLLCFWLLKRMTRSLWKSAFVAG